MSTNHVQGVVTKRALSREQRSTTHRQDTSRIQQFLRDGHVSYVNPTRQSASRGARVADPRRETSTRNRIVDSGLDNLDRGRRTQTSQGILRTPQTSAPNAASSAEIHTTFDPNHGQDITTHLELPISDDFGDELEEFCRLKRLGDFRAAINYFDDNLTDYQNHPYVFVQYAEMVLEMGDYKAFDGLKPRGVFASSLGPGGSQGDNDMEIKLLRLNWDLLEAISTISRQGTIHQALGVAKEAFAKVDLESEFGSTEVQIFKLAISILGQARLWGKRLQLTPSALPNLRQIYERLLNEGRIWDFRDFFTAILRWSDYGATMMGFFETSDHARRFIKDWTNDDEEMPASTNLGLLDVVVFILLLSFSQKDGSRMREHWFADGQSLADSLQKNHPEYVRSRTFARWTAFQVANSSLEEGKAFRDSFEKNSNGLPGMIYYWGRGIQTPAYVPAATESPGWDGQPSSPKRQEPVTLILKLSRELDDYDTEAMCLELLIVSSEDPGTHFDELARLQDVTQDRYGFLWTCFSRYLISKDESSQKRLLEDLDSFPDWLDPTALFDPEAYFARDFIRGALVKKLGGKDYGAHPSRFMSKCMSNYERFLPESRKSFIRTSQLYLERTKREAGKNEGK